MRRKHYLIIPLFVIVILAGLLFGMRSMAKEVEIVLTTEKEEVKKGDELTVLVEVNSETKLKAVSAYISYDDTKLEYVKSESSSIIGAAGVLQLEDTFIEGEVHKSYEITMRALDTGICDFEIYDSVMEEFEENQVLKMTTAPARVTIVENQQQSSETRLQELLVFPGNLEEEFSPDKYSYTMIVEKEVKELILSAYPMDESAVVEIEQDGALKEGENQIKIVVTSLAGTISEYNITVIK
ncbi:cadherin-like beta sandwich domain-containing protein [Anaeromicropila populeti]|uniref:Cohesin domain-containing protein n=1 Tax=Anaeromicropila populeti TaxID=37658 RepID=A0A1I6LUM4_9FIRM|nr:cadherin-like beta sandwich domain-containing protein [Anaeromicropila populeti]SFS07128.1 Cohesin domain-containing protein [Anaeromicropila populeti]